MFGSEAAKILDYVECFPDGVGKGRKIAKECEIVKIEGFPTWVIKGKVKYTFSNELQPNYCLYHSSYQCVLFFFQNLPVKRVMFLTGLWWRTYVSRTHWCIRLYWIVPSCSIFVVYHSPRRLEVSNFVPTPSTRTSEGSKVWYISADMLQAYKYIIPSTFSQVLSCFAIHVCMCPWSYF